MKLNYKVLGDYITKKGDSNKDMVTTNLLGINNAKYFVKAKTNLNGIDLSKYRLVEPNQFAFNRATTRNGDKISIALREGETCIVSPSYRIFQITDENKLDPQYLIMWFRRPEFDRYARFKSHGSAHEFFDYDEMCNVELPIPAIEKQREIVHEYNLITRRIKQNEALVGKLEDTALTIYKQWFVDFEFPISRIYAESIGKPELEGKPYQSSGGVMEYCDELEQNIPKLWGASILDSIIDEYISHRGKSKSALDMHKKSQTYNNPVISAMHVKSGGIVKNESILYVDENDFKGWMLTPLEKSDVILTSEAPMGELMYLSNKTNYLISQRLFALRVNKDIFSSLFLYYWLGSPIARRDMEGRASGTVVAGIKLSELKKVRTLMPNNKDVFDVFESKVKPIRSLVETIKDENRVNTELLSIILAKLSII